MSTASWSGVNKSDPHFTLHRRLTLTLARGEAKPGPVAFHSIPRLPGKGWDGVGADWTVLYQPVR